jgi:ADP-ribose pyrophosphatase YjhB (NUDIX family)
MNYCSYCAAPVVLKIPEGDSIPRYVCETCHTIHYQNPKIIVGCLPEWQDKVLLCRRAIEPRYGLWTLPAGFMENGETTEQGAIRETYEEAGATVALTGLYSVFSLPHISQVYLLFRGNLINLNYAPGPESLEVRLFSEEEIPWEKLAFQVVRVTLECYFRDRHIGQFQLHVGDVLRAGQRPPLPLHTHRLG